MFYNLQRGFYMGIFSTKEKSGVYIMNATFLSGHCDRRKFVVQIAFNGSELIMLDEKDNPLWKGLTFLFYLNNIPTDVTKEKLDQYSDLGLSLQLEVQGKYHLNRYELTWK